MFLRKFRRKLNLKVKSRKNRQVFARVVVITFLLALLSYFLYWVFLKSTFFSIDKISYIGGNEGQDTSLFFKEQLFGKNLIIINSSDISDHAASNFPVIERAVIEKKFPKSIIISITERTPLAIISAKNGNFVVDKNGQVFCEAGESLILPKVVFEDNLSIGDFVNAEKIMARISLLSALKEKNIPVSEVSVVESSISALIKNGPSAIFEIDADFIELVSLLKQILLKYKIEGKDLRKVDLRFQNPVVSF